MSAAGQAPWLSALPAGERRSVKKGGRVAHQQARIRPVMRHAHKDAQLPALARRYATPGRRYWAPGTGAIPAATRAAVSRSQMWAASCVWTGCHHRASLNGTAS